MLKQLKSVNSLLKSIHNRCLFKVPVPLTAKESQFRSMKWLIEAINTKDRRVHFPESLAHEMIDAANNTGRVVKRKQDLHKQCEANRAYAHYRWS